MCTKNLMHVGKGWELKCYYFGAGKYSITGAFVNFILHRVWKHFYATTKYEIIKTMRSIYQFNKCYYDFHGTVSRSECEILKN